MQYHILISGTAVRHTTSKHLLGGSVKRSAAHRRMAGNKCDRVPRLVVYRPAISVGTVKYYHGNWILLLLPSGIRYLVFVIPVRRPVLLRTRAPIRYLYLQKG